MVVNDLKTQDAALQEAWVSGGDSADLQALISDTDGASGSDQLNTDAATFNADASSYLSANVSTRKCRDGGCGDSRGRRSRHAGRGA
jgi:hypothetical protein